MNLADIKIAFEQNIVLLPLEAILPLKQVSEVTKRLVRYKRIAQSIAEVGLIEPLVVSQQLDEQGKHLLLDGHWRRAALLDAGETTVRCIFAYDDETFTYNKQVESSRDHSGTFHDRACPRAGCIRGETS